MIYTLVYILTSIFDIYVVNKMMSVFFSEQDANAKALRIVYAVRYFITVIVYLAAPYPIVAILVNLLLFFVITLCYQSKMLKKILVTIFSYLVMFISELIVAIGIGLSDFSPFAQSQQGNSFCLILIKLVALILVTLLRNFKNTKEDIPVSWTFFFASLIFSGIIIYLEIQIFMQKNIDDLTYALSLTCVMMLSFIIFYLYDSLSKSFREKMMAEITAREVQYYQNQAKIISNSSNDLKQFRHDIKNHIIVIEQLLEQNKNKDASKYLSELTDKLQAVTPFSNSGNVAVDSILNYKLTKAKELGIEVQSSVFLPKDISIDEDDFVVILGNLLDNSLEATQQVTDHPYIHLHIKYSQGTVMITVSNNYCGTIRTKHGQYQTTKSNAKLHGIGLKSIQSTIKKYNGEMELTHDEQVFTAKVMLFIDNPTT